MSARRHAAGAGAADQDWTDEMVRVGNRDVHVRTSRDVPGATPIVHLHGFAISGTYLMPTARRLASRATNVVPDLPGYGRSEGWGATLGIPALGEALLGLLDALGLDRVVLVGNSMGCPVGLEVAHVAPERVERLVLVSPAGGMYNQPLSRGLAQLARDVRRERPEMARVAVPDYVRFGPANTLRLFSELVRYPSLERLVRLTVPALAVVGSRDPMMPPRSRVMEVARLAPPHVTLAVIGGAAHAMNFSHPGELAHVIGSWLDGEEIVDDPDEPGFARVIEVPRG
ncbi:alpha/beta fold hydrolase [Cellulomonas sp. Marseille-Q8402]